jgi:hypothetical protein
MTFPVLVEPCDGQFAAMLVGAPTIREVGPTPGVLCKSSS